jgi:hypothetical protein
VDQRASLGTEEKRKIFSPCRGSNLGHLARALPLYQLSNCLETTLVLSLAVPKCSNGYSKYYDTRYTSLGMFPAFALQNNGSHHKNRFSVIPYVLRLAASAGTKP